MRDLFISYSRKDIEFGKFLRDQLIANGKEVWTDWIDISATAEWWDDICRGIESSDNFVLVISPASLASVICHLEIEHARKNNKRIIPLQYKDTDPELSFAKMASTARSDFEVSLLQDRNPLVVAYDNWRIISAINWIVFVNNFEFDKHLRRLIESVDLDIDYVRHHTRILMRAKEWNEQERRDGYLLYGDSINDAEEWLERSVGNSPQPTQLQQLYIQQSRSNHEALQERERRKQEVLNEVELIAQEAQQSQFAARQLATLGFAYGAIQHRLKNTMVSIPSLARSLRRELIEQNVYVGRIAEIVVLIEKQSRMSISLLNTLSTHLIDQRLVPIDVQSMLPDIVKDVVAKYDHLNITYTIDLAGDLPIIEAPQQQIEEIFTNLVENACRALRHVDYQREIHIQGERVTGDGQSFVALRVSDNGPGIPPEVLPRLFRGTVSASLTDAAEKTERSGLGLYLSSLILASLDGSISVEHTSRTEPTGTTFLVKIPVQDQGEN